MGYSSFPDEADALVSGGHLDEVIEAFLKHLLPVPSPAHDVGDADALVAFREVPEILPRFLIRLERPQNLGRDDEFVVGLVDVRDRGEPDLGHFLFFDQFANPLLVGLRQDALRPSGRKPLGESLVVYALDGAVYPAEAERLVHRVVVRNAGLAGFLAVEYDPYLRFGPVIFFKPGAPLTRGFRIKGFAELHRGIPVREVRFMAFL